MRLFTIEEASAVLAGLREHVAAMQSCKREIDGLREGVMRLRQTPEGTERLLEVLHGLAVGRACHSPLPRLPAVR